MTHSLSTVLFAFGLLATAAGIGHSISAHQAWATVASPAGIGELLIQLSSVGIAITGALGMTPPAFLAKKPVE
jgi:hypothetical protein